MEHVITKVLQRVHRWELFFWIRESSRDEWMLVEKDESENLKWGRKEEKSWPSLKLKEVIIMRVHAEKLIKSVVTVLGVLEWDGPSLTERYLLAWIRSMHLLRTSHCEIEALQWLDRLWVSGSGSCLLHPYLRCRFRARRRQQTHHTTLLLAQDICLHVQSIQVLLFL